MRSPLPPRLASRPLDRPVPEALGLRECDARRGELEVDPVETIRTPAGSLQGTAGPR